MWGHTALYFTDRGTQGKYQGKASIKGCAPAKLNIIISRGSYQGVKEESEQRGIINQRIKRREGEKNSIEVRTEGRSSCH